MLQDMESTEPADVLLGKNPEELTAISVEAGLPRFPETTGSMAVCDRCGPVG